MKIKMSISVIYNEMSNAREPVATIYTMMWVSALSHEALETQSHPNVDPSINYI